MRAIHKYKINPGVPTLMPKTAVLLSVGQQGDDLMCWANVDEDEPPVVRRRIGVYGTGQFLPHAGLAAFLGTVICRGSLDGLVFHIFDEGAVG